MPCDDSPRLRVLRASARKSGFASGAAARVWTLALPGRSWSATAGIRILYLSCYPDRVTNLALPRAARWLAIAYAAAMAVVWGLWASWDQGMGLFAILAFGWQIAPVAASALLVRASAAAKGQSAFLLLEIALILVNAALWVDLNFVHLDPQNPIALVIFFPLYQLAAVGLAFVGALFLGWRARPNLRKG